MPNDIDQILDILEKARKRIEELESQVVLQQAMIRSVLLCLRDTTGIKPEELEKRFQHYLAETHQELLERVEDVNPEVAARLDNRPPI